MGTVKRNRVCAVLFMGWLWSGMSFSQELVGDEMPYTQPLAAEGVNLELELSKGNEVVAVRIAECEGCKPRTFLPAPDMEIRVSGRKATAKEAQGKNGGGGTVLYNPENKMAEVVIFYGR